jgi:hypothetical protein
MWGGSEENQKFWNLVVFKVWATDKEFEEMVSIIGIFVLILVVIVGFFICGNILTEKPLDNPKAVIVGDSTLTDKPLDDPKTAIVRDSI